MRRRNNNFSNDFKKIIAANVARNILKDVGREIGREMKKSAKSKNAPPPPRVNMTSPPRYDAGPRATYNPNNTSYAPPKRPAPPPQSDRVIVEPIRPVSRSKTKSSTDGKIALIIILVFVFANVIANMLDLVIGGIVGIALLAALIAAIVFFGKFLSKKSKERKEKKAAEEAERQKLEAEEKAEREAKEAEEKKKQEAEAERRKNLTGNEELDKIILEGSDYIEKLRAANVAIEHEGISNSIDRMEKAAGDIFEFVKEHPDQIPEIKKFMNYYLPTTLKLLNSYEKLSRQSVKGENIQGAMFDIEGMMETIATAFEKQLDFLFGTQIMDLQADITVMESILEQEGLKDSDSLPKLKL